MKKAENRNEAKADKNIVNEDVAEFLTKSADARMMDTKEGELAITNGTTTAIQNYGRKMVKDQAILLEKIKALAAKRKISFPTGISDKKQKGYDKLAKQEGQNFDEKLTLPMLHNHLERIDKKIDENYNK